MRLRVENLANRAEQVERWRLLTLPAHLATKFAALLDRPESLPGEKDRDEIRGLLALQIDPDKVGEVLTASEADPLERTTLIREAFEYLQDLKLERAERRRFRELAKSFVKALGRTPLTG